MDHIVMTRDGAVGIITIDRRERFNSLDVQTARDLRKAGLSYARDPEVRAVVLRGSGGVFCSGADLKYIRDGGDREELGYLHPGTRAVPREATGRSSNRSSSTCTAPSPRSGARPNRSSQRSTAWRRRAGWASR
jgi:enoyl-CoA hydratase/carnithine racemase